MLYDIKVWVNTDRPKLTLQYILANVICYLRNSFLAIMKHPQDIKCLNIMKKNLEKKITAKRTSPL